MKFYFTGAAKVGKTTLVKSLLNCFPKQWNIFLKNPPSYKAEKDSSKIVAGKRERTVGVDVHLRKAGEEHYFLVYDLGGEDCFCSLQSHLLICNDSIFFVVFNVEDTFENIKTEINKQLQIISSHNSTGYKPHVFFVGTHFDRITENEKKKREIISKIIEEDAEHFQVKYECIMLVDARNSKSSEIIDLSKKMKTIAQDVLDDMVSSASLGKFMVVYSLNNFVVRLTLSRLTGEGHRT